MTLALDNITGCHDKPTDHASELTGHRGSWWCHQMDTFSALLALCEGNPPVTGGFTSQRPVTRSFGVFLDLRLNKWLSKQSGCRWFEAPSGSLWRHFNALMLRVTTLCKSILAWFYQCFRYNWDDQLSIERFVQERRNSSALSMGLRLFCTNPSQCESLFYGKA